MEWHLWGPGDKEPTVYEDPVALQEALSRFNHSDVVMVHTFKRINMGMAVYNGPGGNQLPSRPTNPVNTIKVTILHVKRS